MVDKNWFVFLRKSESLVLCPAVVIINFCAPATFQNFPVFFFLKNGMKFLPSGMHNNVIKEKCGWFSSLHIRLHLTSHEICIISTTGNIKKKRLIFVLKFSPFFFFQVGKESTQNKNIYNWEGVKRQILQYYLTKHLQSYCTVKLSQEKMWDVL